VRLASCPDIDQCKQLFCRSALACVVCHFSEDLTEPFLGVGECAPQFDGWPTLVVFTLARFGTSLLCQKAAGSSCVSARASADFHLLRAIFILISAIDVAIALS
jgi:hypothetical protein